MWLALRIWAENCGRKRKLLYSVWISQAEAKTELEKINGFMYLPRHMRRSVNEQQTTDHYERDR